MGLWLNEPAVLISMHKVTTTRQAVTSYSWPPVAVQEVLLLQLRMGPAKVGGFLKVGVASSSRDMRVSQDGGSP